MIISLFTILFVGVSFVNIISIRRYTFAFSGDVRELTSSYVDAPKSILKKKNVLDSSLLPTMAHNKTTVAYDHSVSMRPNGHEGDERKLWKPVHCPTQMANRKGPESIDPNKDYSESPKRYINTTTYPPFWISLHKKSFDRLRWASIMKRGRYYEYGITDQFNQILENQDPGLVIDIGMNIGWFTLLARAHGHSVVAFEPNPIMFYRMCESMQLNGWDDANHAIAATDTVRNKPNYELSRSSSIEIFPYGLGTEIGSLNLNTGKNPGESSFVESRVGEKVRRQAIPVQVTTLDDIAIQEGWIYDDAQDPAIASASRSSSTSLKSSSSTRPRIYLMKVDVEGFEPYVLQGGEKLLNSGLISNIIFESSSYDKKMVAEMLVRIYKAGYRCNLISDANGKRVQKTNISSLHSEIEHVIKESSSPGFVIEENVGWAMKMVRTNTLNLWWTNDL